MVLFRKEKTKTGIFNAISIITTKNPKESLNSSRSKSEITPGQKDSLTLIVIMAFWLMDSQLEIAIQD